MKKTYWIIIIFLCTALTPAARAKTLKLCMDERNWYPFTFVEAETPKGMHVDVVRKALEDLGYDITISVYPRRRCIYSVEKGMEEGMISIAYDDKASEMIEFPKDAPGGGESLWRIMQVDHMAVTHISENVEFEGDLSTLPLPVRIPRGESLIQTLSKMGLHIDEGINDEKNFYKMIRDGKGTVITTSVIAEAMNSDPRTAGKFVIQPTPLSSQSYFLAFSRKATLTEKERQEIWDAIARWRDDYVFMLQLFAQY